MVQGYQLMAAGPPRYLDLAINCARSINYWDGTRPVQLVTDDEGARRAAPYSPLFHSIDSKIQDRDFHGAMMKLLAFDHSPFEETLFIDADCLLLKPDIDTYWQAMQSYQFGMPGHIRSSGKWYGMQIEDMCRLAGASSLVQLNSGAFYFRKSAVAEKIFSLSRQLYFQLGNFTGHIHRGNAPSDEPYIALALGLLGTKPFPISDNEGNGLMISTINSSAHSISAFDGRPRFVKGGNVLSPTIVHFVGLEPKEIYRKITDEFAAIGPGAVRHP